jgi:hypothetical protein
MKREVSAIIPSIAPETSDLELDRVLDPARFFDSPADVLAAPDLYLQEKRAILSSWASDACSVESMPALRKPPGAKRPVTFDEIMDALRTLDGEPGQIGPATEREGAQHLDA